ncbi:MAG: efflux RND transporter permease subunit [Bacteroidales bacterium]|nr:efflux RND transporter permease subunit [Bacteroidales bacterium]
MRNIIEKFIKYPFYTNLIIIILLVGGVLAALGLKKSFFPENTPRFIVVSVYYPGASPKEMEEGVTTLIEESVRSIVGIKEIVSNSSEDRCTVTIESTGEYDLDEILMEVKNSVDGIASFPSAAERPLVFKVRPTTPAIKMALYGETDYLALKNYANIIEEDLLNSGKISQVKIENPPTPEIAIEVTEEQLLRYGLTFQDIATAIASENKDISVGQIKNDEEELLMRINSRSAKPSDIGNIIIKTTPQGAVVRVRDVALVKKKANENFYPTKINGKNAITIDVNKLKSEDLQVINDYCVEYVENFNIANEGVELKITRKFIDRLQERLDLLLSNGGMGLILVVITLALFLNFRLALWVAWGIPSAFLAMFIAANLMGITINMLSLFGMILVIGILVDDGIVIAENIYTHFEKGKSPMHAAIDGTMEVLPSVITSVSTTIIAFIPLVFLKGSQMEMMVEVALVVILSLGFSLLEAFFVLPIHLSNPHILSKKSLEIRNTSMRGRIEKMFTFLREKVYDRYLKWGLRWRYPVAIALPIFLFLITIGLFKGEFIKTTIFPSIQFDDFTISVAFTPGNGEKQTYEYLEKFEQAVNEVNIELTEEHREEIIAKYDTLLNIIDHYSTSVGSAFSGEEIGAHAGELRVFPIELEGINISSNDISSRVSERIGDISAAKKFSIGGTNRWGAPVSISVMSRNDELIEGAKELLLQELKKLPELKNVKENNALGKQEIKMTLKPQAQLLGFTNTSISNQIRQGFYGAQIQRIQEGRNELRIWVRYPENNRAFIGQLESMKIKTAQGEFPLSQLVDYKLERGPVSIKHLNGKREIRVEAETADFDASVTTILSRVSSEVIPIVKAQYPSVSFEFQGQAKFGKETGSTIGVYFIYALIAIFLILMIHFRSWEEALIIFMMIPIAMLGVFWGHGIHDKMVSMMSMQGMIALAGVVINDSVVFLSKYKDNMLSGMKINDAIIDAGKSRLRAILLTSLTTILGLGPLIFEKSFQAQFLIPMAISLAYGILFGTLFILLFFPLLIRILNDLRRLGNYFWTGKLKEPEAVDVAVKNENYTKIILEE